MHFEDLSLAKQACRLGCIYKGLYDRKK